MRIASSYVCSAVFVMVGVALVRCADGSGDVPPTTQGDSGADDATPPLFGDGAPPPGNGCAADLQTVVDPNGKPIEKCAPDQGCLAGKCVLACDAAAGSKSTIGCDYFAHQYAISTSNSDTWWLQGDIRGGCYAAVVVNTWPTAATLSVSRAGKTFPLASFARVIHSSGGTVQYDPMPATGLPSNEAAVLFLSYDTRAAGKGGDIPCPPGIVAAMDRDAAIHLTGYQDAFHITSDRPISAYQVYPWGGAPSHYPSATILYPSTAWDTNYVAPGINDQYTGLGIGEKPFMTLVAREDTSVTLLPKIAIDGNSGAGITPTAANTPVTYSIKSGQYLQLLQAKNLGGTIIQSTKPVGLFIGAQLMWAPYPPISGGDADNQGLMIPPIHAQGFQYVGASYDLTLPTFWQIVGAVNGTTLTYDPAPPVGAPTTLQRGEVIEWNAKTPFSITSQDKDHPFYLGMYKRADDPGTTGPDFVNVLPPVQFRDHYVFVTDPTYKNTVLVFVRPKTTGDVTLDCLGAVTGWMDVGSGAFQVARVTLGSGNSCKNGSHDAKSAAPFGVTVWGWDFAASYGYPAGGNSAAVNNVVVAPIPN